MISKISGKLSRISLQFVYIDTGSIEYEVLVPLNVLEKLQNLISKKIKLYIYHHFQGEEQKLYGFLDVSQRELFKTIIQLKGIGPSLGLSVLSHLNTEQLLEICEKKEFEKLMKIPRIGKSLAEELIFEVNRKKKKFLKLLPAAKKEKIQTHINEESKEDIIQALKSLGYKETVIKKALEKLENQEIQLNSISEWVREVLKVI